MIKIKENEKIFHRIESPKLIDWEQVLKITFPYVLSIGYSRGNSPKCKGCMRSIKNRNELRVKVKTNYSDHKSGKGVVPMISSFCVNSDCILTAYDMHTYYPSFNNRVILVPPHLNDFKSKYKVDYSEDIKFLNVI